MQYKIFCSTMDATSGLDETPENLVPVIPWCPRESLSCLGWRAPASQFRRTLQRRASTGRTIGTSTKCTVLDETREQCSEVPKLTTLFPLARSGSTHSERLRTSCLHIATTALCAFASRLARTCLGIYTLAVLHGCLRCWAQIAGSSPAKITAKTKRQADFCLRVTQHI